MRTYFALFLAVWLVYAPAVCWALPSHLFFRRAPDTPAVNFLVNNEGFEGTGVPTGWTNGGTAPNWDYTTTVITGAQSLYFGSTSASGYFGISDAPYYVAVIQFRMIGSLPGTSRTIVGFRNGTTEILSARVQTTGGLIIFTNGSASTASSGLMAVDTNYWIKLIWNAGGTCSAEFSTTTTFLGSGTQYRSGTAATGVTLSRFYLGSPSNSPSGYIVDSVYLSTSDFAL